MTIETDLSTIARLADLEAENERLREALQRIADADGAKCDARPCSNAGHVTARFHARIANEALK
mgnify:CR=1 FL=1